MPEPFPPSLTPCGPCSCGDHSDCESAGFELRSEHDDMPDPPCPCWTIDHSTRFYGGLRMGRVAPNPVKPHVCEDADYLPHCETCGTIVYWSDDHQRFIHVMVALEPEARRTVADYWATCPECAVGKCGNCNGQAWDDETDAPIACPCWVDGHSSTTSK